MDLTEILLKADLYTQVWHRPTATANLIFALFQVGGHLYGVITTNSHKLYFFKYIRKTDQNVPKDVLVLNTTLFFIFKQLYLFMRKSDFCKFTLSKNCVWILQLPT